MEGSYASLVSFSVLEQACQETDAHSSTPEDEQVSDLPYWNHPCAPKTECSVPFEVNTSPHSLSWHFTVSLKLQQGVPWWPSSYDSGFHCHSVGSVPGWENEIPQAVWCG